MKKNNSSFYMYPIWFKPLGFMLLVLAVSIFLYRIHIFDITDFSGASFPFSMGLMLIFFAREKVTDERVIFLKIKSLAIAVPIAAFATQLINYSQNYKGYSVKTNSWFSISAFEFLSITLLIALGIYYYLKIKD